MSATDDAADLAQKIISATYPRSALFDYDTAEKRDPVLRLARAVLALREEVDTRNVTIDHLAAENAAMREALEKIASETAATWVCDTARAALGGRDE